MARYLVVPSGRYEITDTLRRPPLNRLLELKKATGLGMRSIMDGLNRRDKVLDEIIGDRKRRRETGESINESLDSALAWALSEEPQVLEAMRALIWLARRESGEQVSIDQVGDFDPGEFLVVADGSDEQQPAVDPTTPATDSDPAVGQQPEAAPQS